MTNKYNILAYIGIGTFLLIGIIILTSYVQSDDTTKINSTTIIGDKEKVYDADTKTITFKEAIGGKETLGSIKLDTPQNFKVGAGYVMIAQYTCSNSSYCFPKLMELYNLTDSSREMTKQIDYKYLSIGTKKVDDYTSDCKDTTTLGNGTVLQDCKQVVSGSHQENEWLPYNKDLKIDKPIIIGLFTYVEIGEKGEWIATFDVNGVDIRVPEFASWDSSLNSGLVSYWTMDNVDYTDNITAHGNNLVETASISNVAGKIGNAINKTGSGNYYATDTSGTALPLSASNTNWTLNYWIKHTSGTANSNIFMWGGTWAGSNMNMFMMDTSVYQWYKGASGGVSTGVGATMGVWKMHTWVYNDNTNKIEFFVDGVSTANLSSVTDASAGTDVRFGTDTSNILGSFVGSLDEVGLWNRTLTATEIGTNLWNGGSGNTYVATMPVSVYCNFTGYVKDSGGSAINGARVLILNQTDNITYYSTTSSANGLWYINVSNNNYTSTNNLYNVISYYNNSLVGISKPYINSTCA